MLAGLEIPHIISVAFLWSIFSNNCGITFKGGTLPQSTLKNNRYENLPEIFQKMMSAMIVRLTTITNFKP